MENLDKLSVFKLKLKMHIPSSFAFSKIDDKYPSDQPHLG